MKKILTLACLFLVAAISAAIASVRYVEADHASAGLRTGANGRYQIIAIHGTENAPVGRCAIRIDTQTGRTWSYVEITEPSGAMKGCWYPDHEMVPVTVLDSN